ncbi:MAG: 2-oxoacid:acceptor oxidoreductase family protein [Acholeplasmataceae bacterium]
MKRKETHIRVAGFGGQGVMMFGQVLAYAATIEEQNALWFPSYGPETRGGTANCQIIISNETIDSPIFNESDQLIVFNYPSLIKFSDKIKENSFMFYNTSLITEVVTLDKGKAIGIPCNDIAIKLGDVQVANMVMMGAYLEITKMFNQKVIVKAIEKFLGDKKSAMLQLNIEALNEGKKYILNMSNEKRKIK